MRIGQDKHKTLMNQSILIFSILNLISNTLYAEVTLDGSLGPKVDLTGPQYAIGAELGQQQGGNLFHSFAQFNLNQGEAANFSVPKEITNIIGRVTGGQASFIDGTIRSTIPHANLYLLNPQGIMFGTHTALDLPGAFHASTADQLRFQDGTEFNARAPTNLLTVAPVAAFGFLTPTPAPLVMQCNKQLTLAIGQTISLIGGNLLLDKITLTARGEGGRINLASVAGPGEVTLNSTGIELSAPPGEVIIQDSNLLASDGGELGGIYLRANQLHLQNSSLQLQTDKLSGSNLNLRANSLLLKGSQILSQTQDRGHGGNLKINIDGDTELSKTQWLFNKDSSIMTTSSQESTGEAGTIELTTNRLRLNDGSSINSTTLGSGPGGEISIQAAESVQLTGHGLQQQGSAITSHTYATIQDNRGGNVILDTKQLQLSEGAIIGTHNFGNGEGGKLRLTITDSASLAGEDPHGVTSRITSTTDSNGQGGAIELTTNHLSLTEGTMISTDTNGPGPSGEISIRATNSVQLAGASAQQHTSISTHTHAPTGGPGGAVNLETPQLQLTAGAMVDTHSFGTGEGGQITLKVADQITLTGEGPDGITSQLSTTAAATGRGGAIQVNTKQLNLLNGSMITTTSDGTGRSGNITLAVSDAVILTGMNQRGQGSLIQTQVSNRADQTNTTDDSIDGGHLLLMTGRLRLMDGARIGTSTLGTADGGKLEVRAKEILLATPDSSPNLFSSSLFTNTQGQTEAAGRGGPIVVVSGQLRLIDNGTIQSETQGPGTGGNIEIQTDQILLFYQGQIKAYSADRGKAGNITLHVPGDRFQMINSAIKTTATKGGGGNITITTPARLFVIGSQITSNINQEFGEGGNITLQPQFLIIGDSQIWAIAKPGSDGGVEIDTQTVYNIASASVNQQIIASSQRLINGSISNNNPDKKREDFVVLTSNPLDTGGLSKSVCNQPENASSFVIMEREGVPTAPDDLIPSASGSPKLSQPTTVLKKTSDQATAKSLSSFLWVAECQPHR